jgi:glyoxylase-like metal-dependent hydrolase (beta-lactamase superfamily II)
VRVPTEKQLIGVGVHARDYFRQDRIHIVGSGRSGFGFTDDYDCHVYLLDGGAEYALIDAGGGRDLAGILARIGGDGLDPAKVRRLLLTHAHADHAAGAAGLRERLGLRVGASPEVARFVRDGDERAASIDLARKAGAYPPDFPYPACPVDDELADGALIAIGDLSLEAVATPGHAAGHLSYVLRRGGETAVFCGDAFFMGGRILLQHTWDCSVQESIATVQRLAALSIDALYPGHHTFTVRNGRREVDKAMRAIDSLLPPPQLA